MLIFEDLVNELKSGCKPPESFLIGVEHEQFALNKITKNPLPYNGDVSIYKLLHTIMEQNDWQSVFEEGKLIALNKDKMGISLEPGGQFEYAGSPLKNLNDVNNEITEFQNKIYAIADNIDIEFLSKGLHPNWSREEIHWMPKPRYEIMKKYMPTKGSHGLDMMLRSCGTQINLDFENEADMIKKFRVCLAVQPIVIALMANSRFLDGRDTGYACYRAHVWADTDNDRSGFLDFVFDDDMSFEKYVNYALDVPMYFIRRNNEYIDMTGKSFKNFMAEEQATLKDWQDHLTTLFPEVRLKQFLELRSADSHNKDMIMAMTAFWVGILYDEATLNKAYDIIQKWSVEQIKQYYQDASKTGLDELHDIAKDFISLAKTGIKNQPQNKDVVAFLNPFTLQTQSYHALHKLF